MPFLGEIPIDPRVAECGDTGDPIVHKHPDSAVAKAYLALADHRFGADRQGRAARGAADVAAVTPNCEIQAAG